MQLSILSFTRGSYAAILWTIKTISGKVYSNQPMTFYLPASNAHKSI